MASESSGTPLYLRIRTYIKALPNVTLLEVANKSGIHPKRFYKIMSGFSPMHASEMETICVKGLGVNAEIFFEDKFSESENFPELSI